MSLPTDTAALRSDSRSLMFPGDDVTVVTMRPSDVRTSAQAGVWRKLTAGWAALYAACWSAVMVRTVKATARP